MKTTKKVTCKAPKTNTFCVVTAALFAAVILTGCPSPANGGNGGNGGGEPIDHTHSSTTVETSAVSWLLPKMQKIVYGPTCAVVDCTYIDTETTPVEAEPAIGDAFKANATGDAMYAQITSVDGLGFGTNTGGWTYKVKPTGTDAPTNYYPSPETPNGVFTSVKDGLENRWANAKVRSGYSIFADLRDSGTWNTYYYIGNEYLIKFIAVSPYNGDYDIYYCVDSVISVLDVTVVITNGTNTYVFNPGVKTIDTAISATPNTTLSALMETSELDLTGAKAALAAMKTAGGYDIYFVVKNATSTQSPSYNEHSTTSYRNVVKVN